MAQVKACSVIPSWTEMIKTSHCSPNSLLFRFSCWLLGFFRSFGRQMSFEVCLQMGLWPSYCVWGKTLGTTLQKCYSEMLARGDLGHPLGCHWASAEQQREGISPQCQACSTVWGQVLGEERETMEIFSSAESWNHLRRLGAAGQLSRLCVPFQRHEGSQAVSKPYSKTDAGSWSSPVLDKALLGNSFIISKQWSLQIQSTKWGFVWPPTILTRAIKLWKHPSFHELQSFESRPRKGL